MGSVLITALLRGLAGGLAVGLLALLARAHRTADR